MNPLQPPFYDPAAGRRGPVGRCDGRDRKRWNPLRSPRAVVFPESRGGSSSAYVPTPGNDDRCRRVEALVEILLVS